MKQSLIKLFDRDLGKLTEEINLFSDEKEIWTTPSGIRNSPGNLCLHICGNLKHFIGKVLGDTDFIREREKEFSLKNVPKAELISNVEETRNLVRRILEHLEEDKLNTKYPIDVFDEEMTTEYFLIHLHSHLNYHLGQINYLRRIIMD